MSIRARRKAVSRPAYIVSMISPVAAPVGNGSLSTTISFWRSRVAAKIPTRPMAIPQSTTAHPG